MNLTNNNKSNKSNDDYTNCYVPGHFYTLTPLMLEVFYDINNIIVRILEMRKSKYRTVKKCPPKYPIELVAELRVRPSQSGS